MVEAVVFDVMISAEKILSGKRAANKKAVLLQNFINYLNK
jgi:hypothetical protein